MFLLQGQMAETHLEIAQQLQEEGSLKEAEKHFVDSGQWKAAVQMWRAAGQWEGSLRLAKAHGGALATKQVCLTCRPSHMLWATMTQRNRILILST